MYYRYLCIPVFISLLFFVDSIRYRLIYLLVSELDPHVKWAYVPKIQIIIFSIICKYKKECFHRISSRFVRYIKGMYIIYYRLKHTVCMGNTLRKHVAETDFARKSQGFLDFLRW